ncbi:hypothetical protein C8R47DRAFT_1065011 [Mycena vitilis]|nr:hypothetical protein C8R47DRAFT_1078085 [Mycena vitilis]KAJ6511448.1 hypothetical protein C8R47DRAFT_1065011 [Mycena vitilis]
MSQKSLVKSHRVKSIYSIYYYSSSTRPSLAGSREKNTVGCTGAWIRSLSFPSLMGEGLAANAKKSIYLEVELKEQLKTAQGIIEEKEANELTVLSSVHAMGMREERRNSKKKTR